jgi:hypothetical protein
VGVGRKEEIVLFDLIWERRFLSLPSLFFGELNWLIGFGAAPLAEISSYPFPL